MQNEFLMTVGAPNESLRLITIYFTFKYSFGIKTTLPESLRSQKKALWRLDLGGTSYNDIVLVRNEFLTLVWAPNDFPRLSIVKYMFKYLNYNKTYVQILI